MKLQHNDIWTRRDRDSREVLWISESALVSNINGLTRNYLRIRGRYKYRQSFDKRTQKRKIMPDGGGPWRYATKNDTFYYDYERIPSDRRANLPTKEEIIELHRRCDTKVQQKEMIAELKIYLKGYAQYLPYYKECSTNQAKHLARACCVVAFGADFERRRPADDRDLTFYRNLAAVIKRNALMYLPKHYRKLQQKIQPAADGAPVTDVIKLPRKGNTNKKAYDEPEVKAWLMHLRSRGENYSNAYITRKVIKMAALSDLKAPSESWADKFLRAYKTDFLTGAGRHGSSTKGWGYQSYVPSERALYAGDCWQMDATRVQILPHEGVQGKQQSLMYIVVRDVHSGEIIGVHFDTKEDRYGYVHALEMAVRAKGHVPYELVTDKFPGHNTPEWKLLTERMEFLGVKMTISSKATAKAAVERGFSTIQQVFMQDLKKYYGEGIQSRNAYAHRSPEYLKRARKQAKREGFDFDAAAKEAMWVVSKYNNTAYCEYSRARRAVKESPSELYEASETPWVKQLDTFKIVELFGLEVSKRIRNNGLIKLEIQHCEFWYQIADYDIVSNYKQVKVCYDVADTGTIYLFENSNDPNRKFLGTVEETRKAQYYGPDADHKQAAKIKAIQKKLKQRRQDELAERTAAAKATEVDALMGALIDKGSADDAQTDWLMERLDGRKDKRHFHSPGKTIAPASAPKTDDELTDDFDDLDIVTFARESY